METMHTACPVHMASAEKITEPSLSAKTHNTSRPERPKQASYVKQVPAKISGGLVWGCPQVTHPPPAYSHLPLLPQRSRELHWPGICRLVWQFPFKNKSHFPLQYLPEPWELRSDPPPGTHPPRWDEANRVNRTRPYRATPTPPRSRPMLPNMVATRYV